MIHITDSMIVSLMKKSWRFETKKIRTNQMVVMRVALYFFFVSLLVSAILSICLLLTGEPMKVTMMEKSPTSPMVTEVKGIRGRTKNARIKPRRVHAKQPHTVEE